MFTILFFVFNGTFIEEPFSYTYYCVFFFCVVITPQNEVFNNLCEDVLIINSVVITPQNGVFNNWKEKLVRPSNVVITPQNGVFNNTMNENIDLTKL